MRKRGGNGATPALMTPRCGKCTLESIDARVWDSNRRHFTQGVFIRKNVGRLVMTQHAAQVRKTSDREAGHSQRGPEKGPGPLMRQRCHIIVRILRYWCLIKKTDMSDGIRITITHRLRVRSGRKSVCHNWFRELRLSYRWWTVIRQNVAVNDACVLPGGTNTCP